MFLRYNRRIWKTPCAPPLHCKQQQEAKSPGETAEGSTEGYPAYREGSLLAPKEPSHLPPLHT